MKLNPEMLLFKKKINLAELYFRTVLRFISVLLDSLVSFY